MAYIMVEDMENCEKCGKEITESKYWENDFGYCANCLSKVEKTEKVIEIKATKQNVLNFMNSKSTYSIERAIINALSKEDYAYFRRNIEKRPIYEVRRHLEQYIENFNEENLSKIVQDSTYIEYYKKQQTKIRLCEMQMK